MTHFFRYEDIIAASNGLKGSLNTIQTQAVQPGGHLNDPLRTCGDTFVAILKELRTVAHDARITADFLRNNVLSTIVSEGESREVKIGKINELLQSASFNQKLNKTAQAYQKVRRLRGDIEASAALLQGIVNLPSTSNRFETVMKGVADIRDFYQQVEQLLTDVTVQLNNNTFTVQAVTTQARWMDSLSGRLSAFEEAVPGLARSA